MIGVDTNVLVRYLVQDDARQAAIASRVAVSHSRAAAKPRSENPAPPGWPSYTKTVSTGPKISSHIVR